MTLGWPAVIEIAQMVRGGTNGWLPSFAANLLSRAAILSPPQPYSREPSGQQSSCQVAVDICHLLSSHIPPSVATIEAAALCLARLPVAADRAEAVEHLDNPGVGPV